MSAKTNKQPDMKRGKEQAKDGAVVNNADITNNNTKSKNNISLNTSSSSDANNVNGSTTGTVRTTGRVKKPKQVYDPSDNYIPRAPRSSITAPLPSQAPSTSSSSSQNTSAVATESAQATQAATPPQPPQQAKLQNPPKKPIEVKTETIVPDISIVKEEPIEYIPNEDERRHVDTCKKCGNSEARRGSGYRSNFLACRTCSMKWHFDCLPMKFDILSNARKRYKCGPCRRCRVCNTKSADKQTEEQLVMCCACVNVYHLDCHWPRVLPDKLGDMNWKCNSCDHTYNPRETDETAGKLGPQLPPRKSKVGRKKRLSDLDSSATLTAVIKLESSETATNSTLTNSSDPDSSFSTDKHADTSDPNSSALKKVAKKTVVATGPISSLGKRAATKATTTTTATKKATSNAATVVKKASSSTVTLNKRVSSNTAATTATLNKRVSSNTATTTATLAKRTSSGTATLTKKASTSTASATSVTKKASASTAASTSTVAKKPLPQKTDKKLQSKSSEEDDDDDNDKDYKPPSKLAKLSKISETAAAKTSKQSLPMKANENKLPVIEKKSEPPKTGKDAAKPTEHNTENIFPPLSQAAPDASTSTDSTENKENGSNSGPPKKGMPVSRKGLEVGTWSVDKVYNYAKKYCPAQAEIFKQQQIDGAAVMVLTRVDICERLGLKLGQALHVYDMVVKLQTNDDDVTLGWAD